MQTNVLKSKVIGAKDIKEEQWHYMLWVNMMKLSRTMNKDCNLIQKMLRSSRDMKSACKIKKLLKRKRRACLAHKLWQN